MGRTTTMLGRLTSEPALLVYSFAIGIYAAILPIFILQKICSPDGPPPLDYVCNDTASVVEATDLTTLRSGLREFVPMLVLMLAGSWRDATGRNLPLMWAPLIGEVVGVSIELLGIWKWSVSPWITSIVGSVFFGLSGGSKLFYVGATCAVSDSSSIEDRTTRMAIYQATAYAGSCLSSAVSGYLLKYLGYSWLFVFVIALHLVSLLLVLCIIKDKEKHEREENEGVFKKMKAVCKSRPNNGVIWMMLISCIIYNVSSGAETNLQLYYLQQGFNFTVEEAGVYSSFRLILGVVSTTVLSPIFSNLLKWSDFKIGILSSVMTLIAAFAMIFARTTLHLIIFGAFDFMSIFLFTLPMSVLTKCVKSNEVGVFVSLRFIGGCFAPIFIYYIYDIIFSATYQRMPGAFYLASSVFILLVLLCFCVCPFIYKDPENEPLENNVVTNEDMEKCENDVVSEKTEFLDKNVGTA